MFALVAFVLTLHPHAAVDIQKVLDGDEGCFIEIDALTGKTLRK